MVEICLLAGWDSMQDDESEGSELELLKMAPESLIMDVFYDVDCIAITSPYLVEVK